MYVKLLPRDLNLNPYPPHLTSIYTCGVTTAPRVRGGNIYTFLKQLFFNDKYIYKAWNIKFNICLKNTNKENETCLWLSLTWNTFFNRKIINLNCTL